MARKSSPRAVKALAEKAKEACGLLTLVKSLCNRADKLTQAEQDVLENAIRNANSLLSNAQLEFWDAAEKFKETETAVRPANGKRLF